MQIFRKYKFLFLINLTLFSCAPPMYKPNLVHAPQLSEKNELKVMAGVNLINAAIDIQSAYALSNHLAVMANFSTGGKLQITDTTNTHKHTFGELGIGYYSKIGEKGRFAFFGGYGRGKSSAVDRNERLLVGRRFEHIDGLYNRWFLQGEVGSGRKPSDNDKYKFEPSIALRYSSVHFSKYESNYDYENFLYRRSFMDFAPTFKVSNGWLGFIIQPGLSLPLGNYNSSHSSFAISPMTFYFGAELTIRKRKADVSSLK